MNFCSNVGSYMTPVITFCPEISLLFLIVFVLIFLFHNFRLNNKGLICI